MFHYGRFLVLTTLVALMPALGARAQQENDRRPETRGVVSPVRTMEGSDLAKDNLRRVAASSAQIQSVLSRDAGILVELKTWVAKEATDNGQVVDDSMLTDQAIFDGWITILNSVPSPPAWCSVTVTCCPRSIRIQRWGNSRNWF